MKTVAKKVASFAPELRQNRCDKKETTEGRKTSSETSVPCYLPFYEGESARTQQQNTYTHSRGEGGRKQTALPSAWQIPGIDVLAWVYRPGRFVVRERFGKLFFPTPLFFVLGSLFSPPLVPKENAAPWHADSAAAGLHVTLMQTGEASISAWKHMEDRGGRHRSCRTTAHDRENLGTKEEKTKRRKEKKFFFSSTAYERGYKLHRQSFGIKKRKMCSVVRACGSRSRRPEPRGTINRY